MICDECSQIQDAELKERKTTTGIHHMYIQCKRCFAKTTCYVTNKRVRRMIAENKELREKQGKLEHEFVQVEENDKKIEYLMEELKERYGYK